MGTKCAPSYAIIFMRKLETEFLSTTRLRPLVWWRYIDDIFIIWPYTRPALNSFLEALNSFHETIKFTSEVSATSVNFLDVKVHNDNQGKLHTSLYTKPTDSHLYLHYSSFHPKHQKQKFTLQPGLKIMQNMRCHILQQGSARYGQTLHSKRIPHPPCQECTY